MKRLDGLHMYIPKIPKDQNQTEENWINGMEGDDINVKVMICHMTCSSPFKRLSLNSNREKHQHEQSEEVRKFRMHAFEK